MLLPVSDALACVTAAFKPLPAEQVSLSDALGRVLAEDVRARVTQPPAAVSAMDGYAVRAADVADPPVTLRTVGEAPAGGAYDKTVGPGEAVRIFTGAPTPNGADAVVMQEDTEAEGDRVTVRIAARKGAHIRPAGLDFSAGAVGLRAGRRLAPRDIGLAAAMNVPWLAVRRRPRVGLIATGDEIVRPGDPIGPNQIVSSNTLALAALAIEAGAAPLDLGIASDDAGSLRRMAAGAESVDVLVISGGASVGEHDMVRSVLGKEGLELDFWRIAMRPGKPMMFGRIRGTPLLGLPGNPVSSLLCAMLFLRPAIDVMLGVETPNEPREGARLDRDLEANDERESYLRARLARGSGGELVATPFDKQDSAMLSTLTAADCLIVRPPHAPPAKAGERVEIIRL